MISCFVRSLRRRRPSMRFGVLGDVADKGRLYRARADFGFAENSHGPTTTFMDGLQNGGFEGIWQSQCSNIRQKLTLAPLSVATFRA